MRERATDGGRDRPDWIEPAARCGLEVALVLLIAAYLWANIGSELLSGVIVVLGIVGAVGVLFYHVNRQAMAWVRYASDRSRQQKRHERRRREKRQRRQRRKRQGGEE
jgi:hypothetical protein